MFSLERFAFVDSEGLIYTSSGIQNDIDQYQFDYRTISEPEIYVKNEGSEDKQVVIAVPVDSIPFNGEKLAACFMEIDMKVMLQGVSMQAQNTEVTFCNIYTGDGVALSGVFAMPGTTFLPVAGPAGTIIAMLIGTAIMLIIGSNFSYLMGRQRSAGSG